MNKQKSQNQIATVIVLGIAMVVACYYTGILDFNPIDALPDVVVIKFK